jgi:hypothetical protein
MWLRTGVRTWLWCFGRARRTVATMRFFSSESKSREGRVPTVRDRSGAVGRLVRFVARMLLWGCVLLLIIRGIASEFQTPQTVTATRGVPAPLARPVSPASTTEGQ